jgi:rare lipoprotein A
MAWKLWMTLSLLLAFGFAGSAALAQQPRQFSGLASYYSKNYKGNVASGARYDSTKLTAAHRTLPFGTRLSVIDPKSHRAVTVVVNDRGPFIKSRVLDLSYAAAEALHMIDRGVMNVTASIE